MRRRILFSVLDWGLGHATRSIPIIRILLAGGCEVVLASDSMALVFLREEFPRLRYYELPAYKVQYNSERIFFNAILNYSKVMTAIRSERKAIEGILAVENISAIITDNRYGCYHPEVPSAIITHQLKFRTGNSLMDRVGEKMVKQWLHPFDRIWIPDDYIRTLSGAMSESDDPRIRCIGWQSTLTNSEQREVFQIAAIISGPEPQRTLLEEEVLGQLRKLPLKCALVRGRQGISEPRQSGNVTVYDYLDRQGINKLMSATSVVLCRTGYSSLMDLQSIGKKAILVPTPGQPEQVYLGKRMASYPNYVVQQPGRIDIKTGYEMLKGVSTYSGHHRDDTLLHDAITDLLALESAGEPA